MVSESAKPEFIRLVTLEEIGPDGLDIEIEADSDECTHLTKRFAFQSLDRLAAQLHLGVAASGISVRVSGRFQARVTRECVVSLEPVESDVDEALEAEFGPAAAEADILVSLDGPEPTEPLVDGRIDLGELVVQHMALALDPYPRRPGAEPPECPENIGETQKFTAEGPFAKLATLRKNDD